MPHAPAPAPAPARARAPAPAHATAAVPGATLANWRQAPFSRWAFRNTDALLPTATIWNDAGRRMPWPDAASVSLGDFSLALAAGTALDLEGFLRKTQTDGFVVIADDRVVCEWMDDGMDTRTTHILMSASKSIVGLLCGVLADRKLIDVDALVTRYIPEVAHTGYAGATLRHLLDMRCDPGFDETDLRRYAGATHWDPVPEGGATEGLHRFFTQLPPRRASHGGAFRYLSANIDLVAWVLERATARPFAELMSEHLWAPMGAEKSAEITLDWDGSPRATGGLCSTLRDFARIGQLMVHAGANGSTQVVPARWIDDIARNGDRQAWADGEFARAFGGLPMRYRSGWYVIDQEPQTLFAMGIHGQHLFVDRAHRLVIAKLSTQPQPLDAEAIGLTLRALAAIRSLVTQSH